MTFLAAKGVMWSPSFKSIQDVNASKSLPFTELPCNVVATPLASCCEKKFATSSVVHAATMLVRDSSEVTDTLPGVDAIHAGSDRRTRHTFDGSFNQ